MDSKLNIFESIRQLRQASPQAYSPVYSIVNSKQTELLNANLEISDIKSPTYKESVFESIRKLRQSSNFNSPSTARNENFTIQLAELIKKENSPRTSLSNNNFTFDKEKIAGVQLMKELEKKSQKSNDYVDINQE